MANKIFDKELEDTLHQAEVESKFVAYITSLFHYNSINFDKKIRKLNKRYSLILDDNDKETYYPVSSMTDDISSFLTLEDQISDSNLYCKFMELTKREREILNFSIYFELSDTKIAKLLEISQQSISKTKKHALRKLRDSFTERSN
ncbi:sigma-70 family RNA polymerase sigma factor [Paenibacillus sp. P46E]|uniref:sigma-70 family RNA polymerase sigma factor n=1 Tax=Paenibacillus sp. P46E TaxID=1349436 RepID=UPI0009393FAE|nr:sigma-70 family RNA polymerase sigma factor [Paenibacillus sp. P46E]OKP96768.1 hypothetical protein A3849_19465 [Paenibacillus sp. P46E]